LGSEVKKVDFVVNDNSAVKNDTMGYVYVGKDSEHVHDFLAIDKFVEKKHEIVDWDGGVAMDFTKEEYVKKKREAFKLGGGKRKSPTTPKKRAETAAPVATRSSSPSPLAPSRSPSPSPPPVAKEKTPSLPKKQQIWPAYRVRKLYAFLYPEVTLVEEDVTSDQSEQTEEFGYIYPDQKIGGKYRFISEEEFSTREHFVVDRNGEPVPEVIEEEETNRQAKRTEAKKLLGKRPPAKKPRAAASPKATKKQKAAAKPPPKAAEDTPPPAEKQRTSSASSSKKKLSEEEKAAKAAAAKEARTAKVAAAAKAKAAKAAEKRIGRGKGGKALSIGGKGGKGGAKRHRKVLRDNIQGVTKPAIRRLARRGGVKRISGLIYEETRGVLKVFLENVIRDSVTYTEHARRKTVTAMDVVYALKRQGRALYGFGG
jgi:histone H3/H4